MAEHEGGRGLKLYVHQGSQPARAVTIFCRANRVEVQEMVVDLLGLETRTPEFKKKNPMGMIPCIDDDGFQLYESHAILRYLATTRNVADHWYPQDPKKRALVDAALDWHHLNLRRYGSPIIVSRVLSKMPEHADFIPADVDYDALDAECVKMLPRGLDQLEIMLQHGKFLQNADEVSIADVSLVCELTQLQLLGSEGQEKVLEGRDRIKKWMADVEDATSPYFHDVHQEILLPYAKYIDGLRAQGHLGAL